MKRKDPFVVTETYSFALAPVIGPFFEALGALAHNVGQANSSLKAGDYLTITSDDDD